MKIDWRPAREDLRAALVEFVLTTFFFWAVFSLVRWGIGAMADGGSVTELRVRVVVVSMAVGLVIVGFATSRPGRFTGCHMNPAITVGLYAFGTFPGRRVVPYLVAQSAGSVAAAALTWLAWGSAASSSVVQPASGWSGPWVFAAEAATLAVIVATMCWMSARRPAWTWHGPWIVGMQFGVQGALLGTFTGGSANPMRQLGPAVFAGEPRLLAVYLLAPIAGALVAGAVSRRRQAVEQRPLPRRQAHWVLLDQHAQRQGHPGSARRGPRTVAGRAGVDL
jgi:glycerol uptake facilitator-like aquaporin